MKVIIDTDPGVDDAFALAYTHSAEIDVKALTTSYGNGNVEATTRNAGYVVLSLGREWPIYQGAERPMQGEARLASCHGTAGLGNVVPELSMVRRPEKISAATFFEDISNGEDVYGLFCLGPLTNIAEALTKSPNLATKIGQLVVMGGAFAERGNVTKHAEFNVYNDPLAWQVVMDCANAANIDTTVIPAEVCRKVMLTEKDLDVLSRQKLLPNLHSIVKPYLDFYMHHATHGSYEGAVLYDLLVPLYSEHPELFTTEQVDIRVSQSGASVGKTVATSNQESSLKVCTGVNALVAKTIAMLTLNRSGR